MSQNTLIHNLFPKLSSKCKNIQLLCQKIEVILAFLAKKWQKWKVINHYCEKKGKRNKKKKKNQLVCIYYQVFIDDYNKRQQPIKCQCCPQCCSGILAESINKTICPSNTVTFIVFNDSA